MCTRLLLSTPDSPDATGMPPGSPARSFGFSPSSIDTADFAVHERSCYDGLLQVHFRREWESHDQVPVLRRSVSWHSSRRCVCVCLTAVLVGNSSLLNTAWYAAEKEYSNKDAAEVMKKAMGPTAEPEAPPKSLAVKREYPCPCSCAENTGGTPC